MKLKTSLLAASLVLPVLGQSTPVFTIPQGYTKVTIAAAASAGETKLTAISATLLNDLEFSGASAIGSFVPESGTAPNVIPPSQTVTATGAGWTANEWAVAGTPHVAYLVNSNGAEQAFLIRSNTADTLTLNTSFDLLSESRFSTPNTVKIRKANTVGSILGTTGNPFGPNDRVFIWDGDNWQTLLTGGGQWFFFGGDLSGQDATNAVIFPEEGIFVQRADTSPIVLTLFGEVPSAPQSSTVAGSSSTFFSTRFPVGNFPVAAPTGIKLEDLNIDEIPGWDSNDRAYFWTGTVWQTLLSAGTDWFYFGGPLSGTSANELIVAPNSAIFLERNSSGTEAGSPADLDLPYNVD